MKTDITKEEYDKLNDDLKGEYEEKGDKYILKLEGDSYDALKNAKKHEAEEHAKTKSRLAELEKRMGELDTARKEAEEKARLEAEEKAKKTGDVDALEKSYQQKLEQLKQDYEAQLETANKTLNTVFVDNEAAKLAGELSTSPKVLLPHIKSRLSVEKDSEGNFRTRVLDNEGKPSSSTLEDLKKEFLKNPDFSGVVTGSKGSGGGTTSSGSGGGAGGSKSQDLSKLSARELAAYLASREEGGGAE